MIRGQLRAKKVKPGRRCYSCRTNRLRRVFLSARRCSFCIRKAALLDLGRERREPEVSPVAAVQVFGTQPTDSALVKAMPQQAKLDGADIVRAAAKAATAATGHRQGIAHGRTTHGGHKTTDGQVSESTALSQAPNRKTTHRRTKIDGQMVRRQKAGLATTPPLGIELAQPPEADLGKKRGAA